MPTEPQNPTSTSPDPSIPLEGDLPGFLPPPPPRRQPTQDPLDPAQTTLSQETPTTVEGEQDQLPPLSSTLGTTGPSRVYTADPKAFEELIGAGLRVSSLAANRRLTPWHERLWLVDDDDVEAIAGPLSRILARHTPVGSGEASDIVDGLEATVAFGGYVAKNIIATREAAAWRQQVEQNGAA